MKKLEISSDIIAAVLITSSLSQILPIRKISILSPNKFGLGKQKEDHLLWSSQTVDHLKVVFLSTSYGTNGPYC